MPRQDYSYPLWVPARKTTTPGSGKLFMSTLWTTLSTELVEEILDSSQADHFDLHITAAGSPKSEETYTLSTDEPEEWDSFFTLLSLTKRSYDRAMQRFKEKASIHVDALQYPDEPRFSNLSVLGRCPTMIVEVVLNLSCSSFDWPDAARLELDLRLTLSMKMARPAEQQDPLNSLWELRASEPVSHELVSLRECMRKTKAYIYWHQWAAMQSIGNAPNESEYSDIYHAWRILRSLLDNERCYSLARGVVSGFVRYRNDTSFKVTNETQLDMLEEAAGRKEILKVLPVFLPYLRPGDGSAVETVSALLDEGTEHNA